MGAGCCTAKAEKPRKNTNGEIPRRTQQNLNPEFIRDEQIILKLKAQCNAKIDQIKKIQAKIILFTKQIKQNIDSNPTLAKALMHKKEYQQKALIRKKNILKILINKNSQFESHIDARIWLDAIEQPDKIMIQDDTGDKIQQARLNAYEIGARQKQNDKAIEQIGNLDRDAGYDSDKELEKYR